MITPDPNISYDNSLPTISKLDKIRDKVRSTIPKINNIVKQNDKVMDDVMNKI